MTNTNQFLSSLLNSEFMYIKVVHGAFQLGKTEYQMLRHEQ